MHVLKFGGEAWLKTVWVFFYFLSSFIDAYVTIGGYVLCMSLNKQFQLKKMSVMYESAHVAIASQLLEMSSITTPN